MKIIFDFTPWYDHAPAGVIMQQDNGECASSAYADSAQEMIEAVKETGFNIHSQDEFIIRWKNSIGAASLTQAISLGADDLHNLKVSYLSDQPLSEADVQANVSSIMARTGMEAPQDEIRKIIFWLLSLPEAV